LSPPLPPGPPPRRAPYPLSSALPARLTTPPPPPPRLHLTEGTVKSHLARIYAKLGVDSRTAAVATATDLGLIRR
ncbi:response regulator transcription factor, partial [Streptomyces fradiae]|uniref:response regulator transcription factor n=1 Tax=Streptomyces fradiae TaxID=1906 RepID=UPI0036A05A63